MIVSLVNQKGGVGKTTIAVNLSSALCRRKLRILLIDADPQGSAIQWHSMASQASLDVLHHPRPLTEKEIKSLAKGFDHILIDAPPALGDLVYSILAFSNVALVPIGPSPLDLWSSKETIELIQQASKENRNLKSMVLICRKMARTRIGREAREAIATYGIQVLNTEVGQRVAYVEAMISGLSVLEYASQSEAAGEIISLAEEIFF